MNSKTRQSEMKPTESNESTKNEMKHDLRKDTMQHCNSSCNDKPDTSNKNKNNIASVWLIEPLFFRIMSNLQCIELSKLKPVSKMFQYELDHKFVCDNFKIYFKYNKGEMKKIIHHEFCNDLSSLLKFYFSFLNIACEQMLFEEETEVASDELNQDQDNHRDRDMTKFNCCDLLFGIKYNGKNKNTLVKFNSKYMKMYQYILNCVDRYYYTCHVEQLIYDVINIGIKDTKCEDFFNNDLNTDALILSSIYEYIMPLAVFCIDLIRHNRRFRMTLAKRLPCFNKDKIKLVLGNIKNKNQIKFVTPGGTFACARNTRHIINDTTIFGSCLAQFRTGATRLINDGTLMRIRVFDGAKEKINFVCIRCIAKVPFKKNKSSQRKKCAKTTPNCVIWDWPDNVKKDGQEVTLIVCNGCWADMIQHTNENRKDECFEYLCQNSFETVHNLL